MTQPTRPDYPIADLMLKRTSPRAFSPEPMAPAALRQCLEALRWAPSCFNAQPWRLLVAPRQDEAAFAALTGCLVEGNRIWAAQASVIGVALAVSHFEHNGKPNAWAQHDVGLGLAQLNLQAVALGYATHLMGGFDKNAVRALANVPEGAEPLVAFVIGKEADPSVLPESLRDKECAPRTRKAQADWVFSTHYGTPLNLG